MSIRHVHFDENNIQSTSSNKSISCVEDPSKIKDSMLQLLHQIEQNINEISDSAKITYQNIDVLKKKISKIMDSTQVDAALKLTDIINIMIRLLQKLIIIDNLLTASAESDQ